MCLGVPMQIENINGGMALCNARGIRREVNLFLVQDLALTPGDYVLVHVGYAIQKIAQSEAQTSWELYDAMEQGGVSDA